MDKEQPVLIQDTRVHCPVCAYDDIIAIVLRKTRPLPEIKKRDKCERKKRDNSERSHILLPDLSEFVQPTFFHDFGFRPTNTPILAQLQRSSSFS
jgi:hypothetical protein